MQKRFRVVCIASVLRGYGVKRAHRRLIVRLVSARSAKRKSATMRNAHVGDKDGHGEFHSQHVEGISLTFDEKRG